MSHYPEKLGEIDKCEINDEKVKALISKLKVTEVAELALFFDENIENVQDLILMPYTVAVHGPFNSMAATFRALFQMQALNRLTDTGEPTQNDVIEKQVADAVAHATGVKEIMDQCTEQAYTDMIHALNNSKTNTEKHVVYRLFSAATITTWTAFETLASDLWAAAVDLCPSKFAQKASAQVDMAVLSKNKFDVSKQMGTILRGKYDFTGVDGIAEAYHRVFENFDKKSIEDSKELLLLEKKRHLLAHRLGRVDEAFNKKTGLALTVGSLVPCELADLSRDANAAIDAGCRLLSFVDAAIQAARI